MAIDTISKRASALNFGDGTTIYLLPVPDGTIADPDKQHLLDCYSGIAFGLPVPELPEGFRFEHDKCIVSKIKQIKATSRRPFVGGFN